MNIDHQLERAKEIEDDNRIDSIFQEEEPAPQFERHHNWKSFGKPDGFDEIFKDLGPVGKDGELINED